MAGLVLSFIDVDFGYESSPAPVIEGLDLSLPAGWTGVIGPNGAGKTTILQLAAGLLAPSRGRVEAPGPAVYCAQRTDEAPPGLAELLAADDSGACGLAGRLGLRPDWLDRWDSLSHGERKRAQLAVALWQAPSLLAIDEPTNHVDVSTRRLLEQALAHFRGIGLLVSHDRELLDGLCSRCLVLDPAQGPGRRALLRRGGYSASAEQGRAEKAAAREAHDRAGRQAQGLREAMAGQQAAVEQSKGRLSKRHLDPRDHDGKGRIDAAKLTNKDRGPGRLRRALAERHERVQEDLREFRLKKEYDLSLWFESEASRRDVLFALPEAAIALGPGRRLETPTLAMQPLDRVALVGDNGSGKSTLVRRIVEALDLPPGRVLYLPQEIDAGRSGEVARALARLPGARLGRVMTVVKLLGSDPEAIRASACPSPGEIRKVLIALGIEAVPHLIVMDEPTNHLDLPSIECLTEALAACRCGLLLASHDLRFLGDLATRWWTIAPGREGAACVLREGPPDLPGRDVPDRLAPR